MIKISDKELNRRWQVVRKGMEERELDFLIFQNNSAILPGYVKWFTDISFGDFTSPITVIFPRDDDMIIIRNALRPTRSEAQSPEMRGIRKQIMVPKFWTSLTYAENFDAEQVVEELRTHKDCHIGWVGLGFIPAAFYKHVTENLTQARFEDATDMIDLLRALKSEEETGLIRETCALEDRLFEYVLTIVKPGESDAGIRMMIIEKCREWGAEPMIMVRTAPAGSAPPPSPFGPPRVLEEGDQLTFLLETSSPTGFWGELSRTVCINKIPAKLEEQFELAREAQKVTLDLLKPGVSGLELWEANNAFMREKGYPEEIRIYAHGQGYDIVERPCLDPDEPMNIDKGMFLAVHPEVKSDQAFGWVCDNYMVTENGISECFHKTEQKIFLDGQ